MSLPRFAPDLRSALRLAAAAGAAILLALAAFLFWRAHRADALLDLFLPALAHDGRGFPTLAGRSTLAPRGFELLLAEHGKFIETPAPAPEELAPLPLPEGAPPVPLRRPFLVWGRTLEPKLKTFKETVREIPGVLKEAYALAMPRDLAPMKENSRTATLEEPFLRDCARFLVQLSAAAGSLGKTDMAALLATFPCNLGVAAAHRGGGFGNATTHAAVAFALEMYALGARALLALAEGPLGEEACQALDNAAAAHANLRPLPEAVRRERSAYLEALDDLVQRPEAAARREEAARAVERAKAMIAEALDQALDALDALDPQETAAALERYRALAAARHEAATREAAFFEKVFAPEELLVARLVRLPRALPDLDAAARDARALAGALAVAARLARLDARRQFPTTAGYFETLSGAKLPRSAYDPRVPVDLSFADGRATLRDGGRVVFSRPFGAK